MLYKDLICLPLWSNFNLDTYKITNTLFYSYNYREKPTSFKQFIRVLCKDYNPPQQGGSKQHTMSKEQYNYYLKYCKYRSKYLELKKQAQKLGYNK